MTLRVNLRICWNVGTAFVILALPFLLGAIENTLREAANNEEARRFFAPALMAAALALLIPGLLIEEMPSPTSSGSPPEVRRATAQARRNYNWNAAILVASVVVGTVGFFLWTGIVFHLVKNCFPFWLPEWKFENVDVANSESFCYYFVAALLAAVKLWRAG